MPSPDIPTTGPRLATKLYKFFINEVDAPDSGLIDRAAQVYYSSGFEIAPVVQTLLLSPQFLDPNNYYKRYAWPVEFVVRALKEVGWAGFSVNDALTPLIEHGAGAVRASGRRGLGARTGVVLERRDARAHEFRRAAGDESEVQPARCWCAAMARRRRICWRRCSIGSRPAEYDADPYNALLDYTRAGGATGPAPIPSSRTRARVSPT